MALNKMHSCHSSLKLFVVTYTFYTLHFLSAQVPSQGYLFALMDQGSRIVDAFTCVIKGDIYMLHRVYATLLWRAGRTTAAAGGQMYYTSFKFSWKGMGE